MGLEGPAEELLSWGGVLGDQQDRADRRGTAEGAVGVGQRGAADGGVAAGAVAAVAGVVGEGAGQRVPKDRTAARLGLPLGRGALAELLDDLLIVRQAEQPEPAMNKAGSSSDGIAICSIIWAESMVAFAQRRWPRSPARWTLSISLGPGLRWRPGPQELVAQLRRQGSLWRCPQPGQRAGAA